MMVMVIVAPTLVILVVQVTAFPLTLHTVTTANEVSPNVIYNQICKTVLIHMSNFMSLKPGYVTHPTTGIQI